MGWWKTTVFHFKHSYLNWRASPCGRKRICVHAIFHHFFLHFWTWLFWFSFRLNSNFSNAWHDNQFFFLLFFFFSFSWSVYSGQQCMSSITFRIEAPPLMRELFWKGFAFDPKLFRSFLSKERIMAQKYFREMGNFVQRASRYQSGWFQSIKILGFCFAHWKSLKL